MVKLTYDLITRCSQFLNAVKEFQIDLRGYKINVIENLSSTNDQFGCIDLSDNSISKLNYLPKLNQLTTLLLINNRINFIENDFALNCINLKNLILTNNKIDNLNEIDKISSCKNLIRLSLVNNIVTKLKYYRLYTIFKIPSLRVLDFEKVKLIERQKAKELFESKKGMKMIENIKKNKFYDENEYVQGLNEIKKNEHNKKELEKIIKNTENFEDLIEIENKILNGEIINELNIKNNNNNNEELNNVKKKETNIIYDKYNEKNDIKIDDVK